MARKEVGGNRSMQRRERKGNEIAALNGHSRRKGRGNWGEEEGRKEGSPFEEKERNCKLGGWRKREREEGG